MNSIGIIFSNIYDAPMGELTKKRTVASMPFGGRYRFIDFVLSNMANSGLTSIGIITKYNYQSLMDHLGSCSEWDLSRKNSGVYILPPFSTGYTYVYRGNLEAMENALSFLKANKAKYVIMCDTTVICNINFEDVIESHKKSGADVTVIASEAGKDEVFTEGDFFVKESGGEVTDIAIGKLIDSSWLVGMGMFVIERKKLISTIEDYVARGRFSFEKDFLQGGFIKDELKINVYKFEKTILRNHSVKSYFDNNFKLMDLKVHHEIFAKGAPIYTKVRDEAPTFYHKNSSVKNCIIADGCTMIGSAENSVFFRDVHLKSGASVKNSIIMQGSKIGKNATLEYVIVDKNVKIEDNISLKGSPEIPLIIPKGTTVS